MKTKLIACAALLMAACCGSPSARKAAATKTEVKHGPEIVLAAPDTVGGTSVNEALANRRSWREYAAAPLTLEELSGVVWALSLIHILQIHGLLGCSFMEQQKWVLDFEKLCLSIP